MQLRRQAEEPDVHRRRRQDRFRHDAGRAGARRARLGDRRGVGGHQRRAARFACRGRPGSGEEKVERVRSSRMYCPQCGIQTEQKTKFCKSCGLKLADHARLLEEPREAERMTQGQWRREKRMMAGVMLMMVTALDLIIFLIVYGSVTISHLEGSSYKASLTTLLIFIFVSLVLGAASLANLISS